MKNKISGETFRSPPVIFILYIVVACAAIIIFRMIFPGEAAPLPVFSRNWRLLQGIIDIIIFFPALVLTALVLPFGLIPDSGETYGRFSPKFFSKFNGPISIAICASVIYSLIFFMAQPAVQDREENLRYRGGLYRLAKERAESHMDSGDALAALQFIDIAEGIWPQTPELADLKIQATIQSDRLRFSDVYRNAQAQSVPPEEQQPAGLSALPGYRQPVDAAEAIALGREAVADERYYDAHWYATLGERLARAGSVEKAQASDLAARAWNRISSLEPDSRERERRSVFRLKQSGYKAMVSGDWISAFYIFQELLELTPDDPDAANFYAACEKGTAEIAFFIDEMELSRGENLTNALFSLPVQGPGGAKGRAVLRFSSLAATADYAYGAGFEYMSFDSQALPYVQVSSPYAKLLPVTIDDQQKVLILMKALDRRDKERRWDAQWTYAGDDSRQPGDSRVFLDVSFEEFLFLLSMRRGVQNLSIAELFSLKNINDAGYLSQSVDAEILGRMGDALLFLPLTILALIIGWRFRAKTHPRYLFIPMLFILPVVFNALTHLCDYIVNNVGIWLILGLGFTRSLIILIASAVLLFFIFLIFLAAQKE